MALSVQNTTFGKLNSNVSSLYVMTRIVILRCHYEHLNGGLLSTKVKSRDVAEKRLSMVSLAAEVTFRFSCINYCI